MAADPGLESRSARTSRPLRLALVTYEYPPDTAEGGIATSIRQIARLLSARGHWVEVFTASHCREGSEEDGDVLVHRVREDDPWAFNARIVPAFLERHAVMDFDLVHGTDHLAHAEEIIRRVPEMPLLLRLHTPQVICRRFSFPPLSAWQRGRAWFGAWRQGKRPWWYLDEDLDGQRERGHVLEADGLTAPSGRLAELLVREWRLDAERLSIVPTPHVPSKALLQIPADTDTRTVTYVGRLDLLKGMVYLTRAINRVLARRPGTRFRLVGRTGAVSPVGGMDMRQWMQSQFSGRALEAVEFMGAAPAERMPEILAGSDICVFPSLWDNFPNACLEAMSAARGIVATRSGGMEEMLDGGRCGRLVPPGDWRSLAGAIVDLLDDPEQRLRMGQAARCRVLETYNAERIGPLLEASCHRAIARRRSLGPRKWGDAVRTCAPARTVSVFGEGVRAGV